MRLNPDCIRDILLVVEEHTDITHIVQLDFSSDEDTESCFNQLNKYSKDELMYHVKQCELCGFFTDVNWFLGGQCAIHYLSPYGHEFLANIRADTNWNKVKRKATEVGSESLSVLAQIAGQIISGMLLQGH